MLFTSDHDLREMQRKSAHVARGVTLTEVEKRRESMEADRELREHRRWREFAFLLFIAPTIVSLLSIIGAWIAYRILSPS